MAREKEDLHETHIIFVPVLLMVFSLFSGLNTTAVAAETDLAEVGAGYGLWVGSTQVTDANKNDILSADTKVTIDDATHLQRYLAEDG